MGSSSRGSSLSSSGKHNPFQFFDRIDQEIEENKQRLKETVPIIRPVVQQTGQGLTTATGPGGLGLGFGHLDAVYEHSESKKGGYNAFFNINFEQFSTSTLSSAVPPIVTTTNSKTSAFSGEKKASGEWEIKS